MNASARTNKTFYGGNIYKLIPSSSSRNFNRTKSIMTNKKTSFNLNSSQSNRETNSMILGSSIDKESLADSILKVERQFKMKKREMRGIWSSINSLNKETHNSILVMEAILTKTNEQLSKAHVNISQGQGQALEENSSLFITNYPANSSKQIRNLQQLLLNSKARLQEQQARYEEYLHNPKVSKAKELEAKTKKQLDSIELLQRSIEDLKERMNDRLEVLNGLAKSEQQLKSFAMQMQFKIRESQMNLGITGDLIQAKTKCIEELERTLSSNKEVIRQLKEKAKEQSLGKDNNSRLKKDFNDKVAEKEGFEKRDSALNRNSSALSMEIDKVKKKIKDLATNAVYLDNKRKELEKQRPILEELTKHPPLLPKDKDKRLKDLEREAEQMQKSKKKADDMYNEAVKAKMQRNKGKLLQIEAINKEIKAFFDRNDDRKRELNKKKVALSECEANEKRKAKEMEPLMKKVKKAEEELNKRKKKAYKEEKEAHRDALNQIETKIKKNKDIEELNNKKVEKLKKTIEINKEKVASLVDQKQKLLQEKQILLQSNNFTTPGLNNNDEIIND